MRSLLRALIAIWLCVTIATTAAGSRTSADGLPKAKIAAPAATGVAVRRTSKALLTHVRRQSCHARLKTNGNINAGVNDVGHERMRACAHTHHNQTICARTPCAVRRFHSRTCTTDVRVFAGSATESDAATLGLDAHARADRNACATESSAKPIITYTIRSTRLE